MEKFDFTETTINSQELYKGAAVHLFKDTVKMPNGARAVREVVRHPGAVCVVPLTDDGNVVMVRQFRYAFSQTLLEIPAGKLERGEAPEDCARRELSEETGISAQKLLYIGDMYPSVAIFDEVIHMYIATGLTFGQMHPDDGEFITVEQIPLARLIDMIMAGDIRDGKTQLALLKTEYILKKGTDAPVC